MRQQGIVCEFDKAGRIIIPNVFRRCLIKGESRGVQVMLTDEGVLLKPLEKKCRLCGGEENLTDVGGECLCAACIDKIRNAPK